jgi:hypothetical protein
MLFWFSLLKVTSYPPSNWTAFEMTCPSVAGVPGKFRSDLLLGLRTSFYLNRIIEKYQELYYEFPVPR